MACRLTLLLEEKQGAFSFRQFCLSSYLPSRHPSLDVVVRYFQVPLQVLRPLYLDDVGTAYVYLVSPCGGVVGGDRYDMTVVLEAGAQACLTTPSATKLYATPGAPAQQRLDITLQARAVLEYLPEQI